MTSHGGEASLDEQSRLERIPGIFGQGERPGPIRRCEGQNQHARRGPVHWKTETTASQLRAMSFLKTSTMSMMIIENPT